jgi:hypothetical protein
LIVLIQPPVNSSLIVLPLWTYSLLVAFDATTRLFERSICCFKLVIARYFKRNALLRSTLHDRHTPPATSTVCFTSSIITRPLNCESNPEFSARAIATTAGLF